MDGGALTLPVSGDLVSPGLGRYEVASADLDQIRTLLLRRHYLLPERGFVPSSTSAAVSKHLAHPLPPARWRRARLVNYGPITGLDPAGIQLSFF